MENLLFDIDEKYERKQKIGAGIASKGRVFNTFVIQSITTKNVFISGKIASGLISTRKINKLDFPSFLKNYKKTQ